MSIFGCSAQILSILGYMSGEYLNGMELSPMSHRHEYVRCAMKGTKTPMVLNIIDDPSDMESQAMSIQHHLKEASVTNKLLETEG